MIMEKVVELYLHSSAVSLNLLSPQQCPRLCTAPSSQLAGRMVVFDFQPSNHGISRSYISQPSTNISIAVSDSHLPSPPTYILSLSLSLCLSLSLSLTLSSPPLYQTQPSGFHHNLHCGLRADFTPLHQSQRCWTSISFYHNPPRSSHPCSGLVMKNLDWTQNFVDILLSVQFVRLVS